jgi:hypothetical protein
VGDLKRTEDGIQKLPGSISTEYKLRLATAAVVALAKDSVERKGYDVARFLHSGSWTGIHRVLLAALRPPPTLNEFHRKIEMSCIDVGKEGRGPGVGKEPTCAR